MYAITGPGVGFSRSSPRSLRRCTLPFGVFQPSYKLHSRIFGFGDEKKKDIWRENGGSGGALHDAVVRVCAAPAPELVPHRARALAHASRMPTLWRRPFWWSYACHSHPDRYDKVGYREPAAGSTAVRSPEEDEFVMADKTLEDMCLASRPGCDHLKV